MAEGSTVEKLEDLTPGDVKGILSGLKKDGEGAFKVAGELSELWWKLSLPGVHNPPAKDDLRGMILDIAIGTIKEDAIGEEASNWWSYYMTGAFNPTMDIEAKDKLAMLLVTTAKRVASS